jgi:hypothetical protein
LAIDSVTATWQLARLPSCPQYGKSRVVNDPDFDRVTPRHLWHHLFAHLGEQLLIRPRGIGDKVQELLMLRETRPGSVTTAIGSTLRRPSVASRPAQ